MFAPLTSIRVLDLTNVLAGPFCCHQLAHFGADVIKVEAVGRGDLARQLGADPALSEQGMGVSFLAQNAGKRSVTLNLKTEQGKALLGRLVETADVLVENFRPGVMQRLALSYESLKQHNPKLIYCAISGFGQQGPWKDRPAYDQIVQGVSGVMAITGDESSAPLRVGYPVADTVGGLTAAFAIAAALQAEERGAYIDVSMMESVMATMGWAVSNYLNAGVDPMPQGNENFTSSPSGSFKTADGLINIAANKEEQWQILTDCLGVQSLRSDPRYLTRELRKEHRHALRADLEQVLATRPAAHWVDVLNRQGVPAGEVLTVADALNHPHLRNNGFISEYPPVEGRDDPVRIATTGVRVNGHKPAVDQAPPVLGEHNQEVWAELGLSPEDIEQYQKQGIL